MSQNLEKKLGRLLVKYNTPAYEEKESNINIWILAIAPLLGVSIQACVSNLLVFNFNTLWAITISVNVLISIYDVEYLKKNQRYSEKIGNPMLVPIYLFNRARFFNHSLSYFFTWCLSLLLVLTTPSWKITSIFF